MNTHPRILLACCLVVSVLLITLTVQAATPESNAPPVKAASATDPEPAVAKQDHINVRAQAAINSEVVTRLKKGDRVTVLEEITLSKPKTDEPARWYRVTLPTNVSVWVHSMFIDPNTHAVVPRRLNLRAGPGENYSIVGRVNKGDVLRETERKGDWIKIEAPTNAYGFVAAHLLAKVPAEAPAVAAVTPPKPPEPVAPPAEVTEVKTNEPIALAKPPVEPKPAEPKPAEPATIPPAVVPPSETPTAIAPAITPPPAVTPPPAEPPPADLEKRIVSREGLLRGSVSIQAPTYFELRSLDTGKTINYVYSPSTNILLKSFKGQRVVVTGEELLDERWPNTPVISIEKLETLP